MLHILSNLVKDKKLVVINGALFIVYAYNTYLFKARVIDFLNVLIIYLLPQNSAAALLPRPIAVFNFNLLFWCAYCLPHSFVLCAYVSTFLF